MLKTVESILIEKTTNTKRIQQVVEEMSGKWEKIDELDYSGGKFIEEIIWYRYKNLLYVLNYGAMLWKLEIYEEKLIEIKKQRPYRFNVDDTWYELRCPCCHKTLDKFHSESLFDEKSCKYCGVELEKSDYQNAYDLQVELSLKGEIE